MKKRKRNWKWLTLLTALLIVLSGCENSDPVAALHHDAADDQHTLQVLKFSNTDQSLGKKKVKKKHVAKQSGEIFHLTHGDPGGAMVNSVYAIDWNPPYNIYQIDPANPGTPRLAGQLAFQSAGIAMHPYNGLVYYVGRQAVGGMFPVGVWDPQTNTSTTLPAGSLEAPNGKLAFHPDGTLFGTLRVNTSKLYTIDTESGHWRFYGTLDQRLKIGGDMVFNKDGSILYNTGGSKGIFKRVDMATATVTNFGSPGRSGISGLSFGGDGNLYYTCKYGGEVGILDPSSGVATPIGNSGLAEINDLTTVIAPTELAYVEVILEILPGAIDADKEVEMSMETTELSGGVAVTFLPHGTTFNPPAILNLTAHGIDFSGVNVNDIDIFYDNQDTGQWEPMVRENIIIDVNAGTIQVVNGQLPHFSRYAIGAD